MRPEDKHWFVVHSANGNAGMIGSAIVEIWEAEGVKPAPGYEDDLAPFWFPSAVTTDPTSNSRSFLFPYDRVEALHRIESTGTPWHPITKKGQDFASTFEYIGVSTTFTSSFTPTIKGTAPLISSPVPPYPQTSVCTSSMVNFSHWDARPKNPEDEPPVHRFTALDFSSGASTPAPPSTPPKLASTAKPESPWQSSVLRPTVPHLLKAFARRPDCLPPPPPRHLAIPTHRPRPASPPPPQLPAKKLKPRKPRAGNEIQNNDLRPHILARDWLHTLTRIDAAVTRN
ncbi:hypothetical protein B0H11DRAFT_2232881 [Mycena galericulata]|nr:hypothetical protein B0H11DRAFT_2232881 [Mycena galericulata]